MGSTMTAAVTRNTQLGGWSEYETRQQCEGRIQLGVCAYSFTHVHTIEQHSSYTFEATLLDVRIFANRSLESSPARVVEDATFEVSLAHRNCRSMRVEAC